MKTEQSNGMIMFEVKKKTIITVNRCKQRQMICKWRRVHVLDVVLGPFTVNRVNTTRCYIALYYYVHCTHIIWTVDVKVINTQHEPTAPRHLPYNVSKYISLWSEKTALQ